MKKITPMGKLNFHILKKEIQVLEALCEEIYYSHILYFFPVDYIVEQTITNKVKKRYDINEEEL